MKRELEEKLAKEFEFMHRGKNYDEQMVSDGFVADLYGAYGCEHGDGWYELLRGLCLEITEAYQKHGQPIDIVVNQVKEKFGTLRFYYHFDDNPQSIHAMDFMGTGSVRFEPGSTDLHKEIASIVRKYEEKSDCVCEKCGEPGFLRKNLHVATLCDSCYGGTHE